MLPSLTALLQYAADRGYVWIPQEGHDPVVTWQYEILMPLPKADARVFPYVPSVEAVRREFFVDLDAIPEIRRRSILVKTAQFNRRGSSVQVRFHASVADVRERLWKDHCRVNIPAWSVAALGPLVVKEVVPGVSIQTYLGPACSSQSTGK